MNNPYSDKVFTDVYSMELGIRLSFVKTSVERPLGTPLAKRGVKKFKGGS
jgi:hypothetical protein